MCTTHMGPSTALCQSGSREQTGVASSEAPQKITKGFPQNRVGNIHSLACMKRLFPPRGPPLRSWVLGHPIGPPTMLLCSRAPRRGFIINLRRCPGSICMEQGQKDGYTLPCRQSRYGVDDGELAGKVDNRRRQCIRWISDERALAGPGPFRLQPLFACREPCGLTGGRCL